MLGQLFLVQEKLPGVYSSVSVHKEWIEREIERNGGGSFCSPDGDLFFCLVLFLFYHLWCHPDESVEDNNDSVDDN